MIVTALSSWEPPPTASLSLNADVNTGVTSAAMDMDGATAEATPTTTTPYAGVELGGNVEPIYRAREYQLEMLEASMKENIIVAMDTGTGKTHIAVLRIQRELERSSPEKLIWFLAPTVDLCIQQQTVIMSHLPAVRTRLLIGADNVDRWTEQSIWDAVLNDVRVVVSTHAVLADAMSHGFVTISRLSLLIFDEAHHCRGNHPSHKIMRDFYHPARIIDGMGAVPHILGLTASPIFRSDPKELISIESNMFSVCKTPKMHRSELLKHAHRPRLVPIWYEPCYADVLISSTKTLRELISAWESLDIEDDPYVKKLRKSNSDQCKLQVTLMTCKTYCYQQMRRFVTRAQHLLEELGEWAADYFIHASIEQLRPIAREPFLMEWDDEERTYIINILSKITMADDSWKTFTEADCSRVSSKLEALITFLSCNDDQEFSGLVFVKQRSTASIMAKLLSHHPKTRDRFRCAAYVGWSNYAKRKDIIGELLDIHAQRDTLSEFRDGRKNLVIATDVLEEGIDVSACSLVVCFDKPKNLKSFVQRRGRARQRQSTFAIFAEMNNSSIELHKWRDLEGVMVAAYQDDERRIQEALALETINEKVDYRLSVESTGALLTPEMAVSHLHHFCAVLPHEPYVDLRPVFSTEQDQDGLVRASVTLPNCVNPAVRRTQGRAWWKSERAAVKDAAFHAYKALYEVGLVNDNLLPLKNKWELRFSENVLQSIIKVSEQIDPWIALTYEWSSPDIHQTLIKVRKNGKDELDLLMYLTSPSLLPPLDDMTLYWDRETTYTLTFEPAQRMPEVVSNEISLMRAATALYLQAPHPGRDLTQTDFVVLLSPHHVGAELQTWVEEGNKKTDALDLYERGSDSVTMGLVRNTSKHNSVHFFRQWRVTPSDRGLPAIELDCHKLPRRSNFLSPLPPEEEDDEGQQNVNTKVLTFAAEDCTIDHLPASQGIVGLFIPAIMHQLETYLIAARLRRTILEPVEIENYRNIITAITAPSAQAGFDYQEYEFFGDSVLKFTVSCQLFLDNYNWHEGYLTASKDELVKNLRLAQAALQMGLDAFIIVKNFKARKWQLPLISEKRELPLENTETRELSSKVLADVVEALIGAAYFEGGHDLARKCIHQFLSEVKTDALDFGPMQQRRLSALASAPESINFWITPDFQKQLGWKFRDESLLVEALTHPSCQFDDRTESYQRLEFLGDAVLDMIIVSVISQSNVRISPGEMTKIKHAVVNANLLAFLCMEFSSPAPARNDVQVTDDGKSLVVVPSIDLDVDGPEHEQPERVNQIWRFMRCQSLELRISRDACLARHKLLQKEINTLLQHGVKYPWEPLSKLHADKFFSDLVESTLGAIFVDSQGNLEECERFVERIGLLTYLRRVLEERVDVTHPRDVAQRLAKHHSVKFVVTRVVGKRKLESEDEQLQPQPQQQQPQKGQGKVENAQYECVVRLNERDIITVTGCLSAEVARVSAANMVVELLASNDLETLIGVTSTTQ